MTHSAKPKVQGKPNEAHEETIEQTAEELQLCEGPLSNAIVSTSGQSSSRERRGSKPHFERSNARAAQPRAQRARVQGRQTEAMVWKAAHSSAAKAAMVLESDKGQLAARLEQEQQERQVLTAAARNDKTH